MPTAITNPTIIINNVNVVIKPNSFEYTEGKGEATIEAQSGGGGQVVPIFATDATTKMSSFKFSVANVYADLITLWKENENTNLVKVIDPLSDFSRTFQQATVTNDPTIGLGFDTYWVDVEWKSIPAV